MGADLGRIALSDSQDIDALLRQWPYQAGTVVARLIKAAAGREVVQMRVELGALQMEVVNRPDGEKPGGFPTFLELLRSKAGEDGFTLGDDQAMELDREFLQFYNRRICWLALREFRRAVADAEHTLALMDFVAKHSTNRDWIVSHEQYRPFVLFHRTQAAALSQLEADGPEAAIEEITHGLEEVQKVFHSVEADEQFNNDELVRQLKDLQQWIRDHYQVGRTLVEQLADAVAAEQYELAARLRDEIAHRQKPA
jgi:hypothetical protein